MANWKEIADQYNIKYAAAGTYKAKIKAIVVGDLDQWQGANVDIKFEPVDGVMLPDARYRLRFAADAKVNWRLWQHRCIVATICGSEENAEKAIDAAESANDTAAKAKAYKDMYSKLATKHSLVEVKVYADENPNTGKTYMRAMLVGKERALDNTPYRPEAKPASDPLEGGEAINLDEVPFF